MPARTCAQCKHNFNARTNGVTCSKECAKRRHTDQGNERVRERYQTDEEFRKMLCGRSARYRHDKALTDAEYSEKERVRNALRMREKRRNNADFRATDGAKTAAYLRKKRLSDVEFQRRDNTRRSMEYKNHRDESAVELISMLRCGDLPSTGNPCFVYLFFDDRRTLLYVGITNDPSRRLYQHARDKTWFEAIETVNLAVFRSETEAMATEAFLIKSMRPLHNIRHNGSHFANVDIAVLGEMLSGFASVDLLPCVNEKAAA